MAKKSAAKPAAAEELKAKKDIQKAVKLETKKKVRPRLLCAHSRRICRNRVAEYCHATPSLFRSSLPPTMIPMTPMRSPRRSRPLRRRSVRAPPIYAATQNMPRDQIEHCTCAQCRYHYASSNHSHASVVLRRLRPRQRQRPRRLPQRRLPR